MKKFFFSLITFLVMLSCSFSTPEFSLWTGSSCATCHVNYQGGGMRKPFGWTFVRDASMFSTEDPSLSWLYSWDKTKYTHFDSVFSVGTDFRFEAFRSPKTPDAKWRAVPMQASVYANLNPLSWISLDGQYNIAKQVFPGQTFWAASAILHPISFLPSLRFGRFQPAIGLRDCDMTSMDRTVPTPDGTETLIPPDYSEYGAELIYTPAEWLQVNTGAYDSKNLQQVDGGFGCQTIVPVNHNPSFTARLILFPELGITGFPATYFGGSSLLNGRFIYNTGFVGVGIYDNLHSYFKYAYSNMPHERMTNTFVAGLTFIPMKGLVLGLRGEHGNTTEWLHDYIDINMKFNTDQIILNARIFVLPYLELIPEYRYVNTDQYKSLRWTFQMHLYY